jgi:GMP synthase (glutamine-hydrolysing)
MSTHARHQIAPVASPSLQAIAIVDLGGQYCHMIGRRLRDIGIRGDIFPHHASAAQLVRYSGIILSGGPKSVNDPMSPTIDSKILKLGVPILGICYGHQLLAKLVKSDVRCGTGEYGKATLRLLEKNTLFHNTSPKQTVWMSHGDSVATLPEDFSVLAETNDCSVAAFASGKRQIYGVQFHPEVAHTKEGSEILLNFATKICDVSEKESVSNRTQRLLDEIRERVGNRSVLFFVSGGVDSTVAFALCARALPLNQVLGVYVDTGLMRKDETDELLLLRKSAGLADRLKIRNEASRFVAALKGVVDPEEKRRIIGRVFVEVQQAAMLEYGIDDTNWLLGQGTIYPDTVESGGRGGETALIKTHHNRCNEIRHLMERGKVIEPLVEFYKDEVRQVGAALGLDRALIDRWPFPGPGLAIRVLCNGEDVRSSRPIDLPAQFNRYDAAHLPIKTVGVQGDYRTFRDVLAVRGPLDYAVLNDLSSTMCNSDKHYNRVIAMVDGNCAKVSRATIERRSLDADRVELLREADHVVTKIMRAESLMDHVWQFPTILIPVSFGDGESIVLRPVNSEDGMTANFGQLPLNVLRRIGKSLLAIKGIDAVFLDITDKPPATIEWE